MLINVFIGKCPLHVSTYLDEKRFEDKLPKEYKKVIELAKAHDERVQKLKAQDASESPLANQIALQLHGAISEQMEKLRDEIHDSKRKAINSVNNRWDPGYSPSRILRRYQAERSERRYRDSSRSGDYERRSDRRNRSLSRGSPTRGHSFNFRRDRYPRRSPSPIQKRRSPTPPRKYTEPTPLPQNTQSQQLFRNLSKIRIDMFNSKMRRPDSLITPLIQIISKIISKGITLIKIIPGITIREIILQIFGIISNEITFKEIREETSANPQILLPSEEEVIFHAQK